MDRFATTRWSLVRNAGADGEGRDALERLCRTYRPPVLAYVRAHYGADEAEDLTQAFFAHVLENRLTERADQSRGRFRAFLLTSLKNFLAGNYTRERAARRGGGAPALELREELASDDDGPEQAFEREWAHTILREALQALQAEAGEADRAALFQHLRPFLFERPADNDYERIAEALGMRRNTIAVAVHRLRARLQELVRELVADTTCDARETEFEFRALRHRLGGAAAPESLAPEDVS